MTTTDDHALGDQGASERAVADVVARVKEAFSGLDGVVAVALGGSRARRVDDEASDLDFGIYYQRSGPPSLRELRRVCRSLDDGGEPLGFAGFGEWGAWINGGAWLRINGQKTDILWRDADQVEVAVRECSQGRPQIAYQVGHPHAFSSAIYMGEVHHNVALYDPESRLGRLREMADPYPEGLAKALIHRFGGEAIFSVDGARTSVARGDLVHVCGCGYRTVAALNQVIFAASGRYLLNEKSSTAAASALPKAPQDYRASVEQALRLMAHGKEGMAAMLDRLKELHGEVMAKTLFR